MLKAGITIAGALGGCGIDLVEIAKDCLDRCVQAVKIETIETYFGCVNVKRRIVFAQPLDKIKHDSIAPHPSRKSFETAECFVCRFVVTETTNVAIDPKGIRPIGFDGDRGEGF